MRPGARRDRRRARAGGSAWPTPIPATPRSSTTAPGWSSASSWSRRCSRPGTSRARDLDRVLAGVRGNPMAKATLIDAFLTPSSGRPGARWPSTSAPRRTAWPAACRSASPTRPSSSCSRWTATWREGYRRIKLKIEPGSDVERVAAVRAAHPDIAALRRRERRVHARRRGRVPALDAFDLLMIEQPLHQDDLVEHAKLQAQIRTDHLPGRVDPIGGRRRRGDRAGGLPDREHQAGPGGRGARGRAGPRRRPAPPASRCGAAACSRPGSAGPRTWRWPRFRGSRSPATPARRLATSRTTSPSRS